MRLFLPADVNYWVLEHNCLIHMTFSLCACATMYMQRETEKETDRQTDRERA